MEKTITRTIPVTNITSQKLTVINGKATLADPKNTVVSGEEIKTEMDAMKAVVAEQGKGQYAIVSIENKYPLFQISVDAFMSEGKIIGESEPPKPRERKPKAKKAPATVTARPIAPADSTQK